MKKFIMLMAISVSLLAATQVSAHSLSFDRPGKKAKKSFTPKQELTVLPGGPNGEVKVIFNAAKAATAKIVVLSEEGATVLEQTAKILPGKNKINISSFSKLGEGYFTICVNTHYKTWSAPFLMWKQ
jgi:maltose-binding protein MalE